MQRLPVHIRWLIRCYMPEVLRIEQECFEFPWVEDDFIHCLRQRNCIGMVATHAELVTGYMIYELHKHHLRALNFAVEPEYRRRGVGTAMVAKLMTNLSPARRTRLELEVREPNLGAQLFFAAQGFRAVEVLPRFYDNGETAYRFVRRIDAATERTDHATVRR